MNKRIIQNKGQAIAEMVFMLPVLIILAGIAMSVAYMCWQGVKVQEAANYAARIEGQQRVGGGSNATSINETNGIGPGGDEDVSNNTADLTGDLSGFHHGAPIINSVYAQYYSRVRSMFTGSEQENLFVPQPKQGTDIDQVKVIRVMNSPTVFGMQIPQVMVTGTAYGGEDTNMYGLPRWGCTAANDSNCPQNQYWMQSMHPEQSTPNPLQ